MIPPSCMYGLALYESQIKEGEFEYLDVYEMGLVLARSQ